MKPKKIVRRKSAATKLNTTVGAPVEITLRSHGTSGYMWRVKFDKRHMLLQEHRTVPSLKGFGAKGKDAFRFEPLVAGDHEISFELVRPAEDRPVECQKVVVHAK